MIPPETNEVSRLIEETHDRTAFVVISYFTLGEFCEWLLTNTTTSDEEITAVRLGITLEMAAAVSKIMRNQDLNVAARRCKVITRFRNTIGLLERLATRLQPNHPTDNLHGIAANEDDS